ncbi:MAG: hypothetical protein HFF17_11725 [Oscillospiraceae bacterium]|nr:hypothetical protein [Oscillospiraceae bacterium]
MARKTAGIGQAPASGAQAGEKGEDQQRRCGQLIEGAPPRRRPGAAEMGRPGQRAPVQQGRQAEAQQEKRDQQQRGYQSWFL